MLSSDPTLFLHFSLFRVAGAGVWPTAFSKSLYQYDQKCYSQLKNVSELFDVTGILLKITRFQTFFSVCHTVVDADNFVLSDSCFQSVFSRQFSDIARDVRDVSLFTVQTRPRAARGQGRVPAILPNAGSSDVVQIGRTEVLGVGCQNVRLDGGLHECL